MRFHLLFFTQLRLAWYKFRLCLEKPKNANVIATCSTLFTLFANKRVYLCTSFLVHSISWFVNFNFIKFEHCADAFGLFVFVFVFLEIIHTQTKTRCIHNTWILVNNLCSTVWIRVCSELKAIRNIQSTFGLFLQGFGWAAMPANYAI